MTDRPILFSGPMVRALLDGRKTQTRRVLGSYDENLEPPYVAQYEDGARAVWCDPKDSSVRGFSGAAAAAVGDRLYVREAWRSEAAYDDLSPSSMGGEESIQYEADCSHQTWGYPAISKLGRFRQGMHMPRWASRLTLMVTDVRVQRVEDISEEDAVAEGVERERDGWKQYGSLGNKFTGDVWATAAGAYHDLWDSLNASRGFGWDVNPWVVAVNFTIHHGNIDNTPNGSDRSPATVRRPAGGPAAREAKNDR